jgi:hypothetical protein
MSEPQLTSAPYFHALIGALTVKVDLALYNNTIWRSRVPIRAHGICVSLKAGLRNPL